MYQETRIGLATLGLAFAIGVLGDTLLRWGSPGLGVALWVATLALAAIWLFRWSNTPSSGGGRWFLGVAVFFAGCVAWRDSWTLSMLNFGAIASSLALGALYSRGGRIRLGGVLEYGLGLARAWVAWLFSAFDLVFSTVKWAQVPQSSWSGRSIAVARGTLIAVPLLWVFGWLFASSDAAFESIVANLFRWQWSDVIAHSAVVWLLAWPVAGGIHHAVVADQWGDPLQGRVPTWNMGRIELWTILGLVDALFLLFVIIQFRYLFGGAPLVEASSTLTYTEYARRGFFELVYVTTLALILLLSTHWLLKRDSAAVTHSYNLLAGFLVFLLYIILVSALQRMRLYQETYGQTELRFYTTAFMAWLAFVLCWFSATVLRDWRPRFAFGALISAFLTIAILNVVNPDGMIATANLTRGSGQSFDLHYTASLSADAVPSALALLSTRAESERRDMAELLLRRWESDADDWRSWNAGRDIARRLIAEQRIDLHAIAGPFSPYPTRGRLWD